MGVCAFVASSQCAAGMTRLPSRGLSHNESRRGSAGFELGAGTVGMGGGGGEMIPGEDAGAGLAGAELLAGVDEEPLPGRLAISAALSSVAGGGGRVIVGLTAPLRFVLLELRLRPCATSGAELPSTIRIGSSPLVRSRGAEAIAVSRVPQVSPVRTATGDGEKFPGTSSPW